VTFDLGFYVEQCRHNDGGETPEEPEAIDLSTGRTDWTVTDPDGTSGPAVDSGANPVWTTAPCADWIDPYGNDPETADPVGTYEFETTFDVAAGGGTLEVSGFAADNEVTLELDGTEIGSTVGFDSLAGPLSTAVDGGPHTLTATVENYAGGSNNPVGLLVCAEVTY
jgi:hypothetical protein